MPDEGDSSGYRPGMALRVAIGFAAVALTVIAANFITQQSAREARGRVRELLVQHEPLVRATEALAATVSLYERVVVDQSESNAISMHQAQLAAQRMTDAATAYDEAAKNFPQLAASAPQFAAELDTFRAMGEEMLADSTARGARLREYWGHFDELEASVNAPHARAVRVAGAVFASERLMDLTRMLSTIRERVSAAASISSPRSVQGIVLGRKRLQALPAGALRGAREGAWPAVADRSVPQTQRPSSPAVAQHSTPSTISTTAR